MRKDQAYAIVKHKKPGPIVQHVPMQLRDRYIGGWPVKWEPKIMTPTARLEHLKQNFV